MEQTITPGQLRCIKALVNKLMLKPQKDDLVAGFTGQRTTHVSEMHVEEAADMIRYLKSQDPEEKKAEAMRKKIMWMAHEMKWELPGGKLNMQQLDGWMVKSSYLHKKINQYRYRELPALVTQFEKVYTSFLKNL